MSFPDVTASASASRVTTGRRADQPEFPGNRLTSGSARFGALSHHSFFSRHNPHPNRVRHIQGLSGRPICTVRDDWSVATSLFPHPLLKSHLLRETTCRPFGFAAAAASSAPPLCGCGPDKSESTAFSEAWREALRDLAAKVRPSAQGGEDEKEEQAEGESARRKTQYSAETGRLVPPPASSGPSRRTSRSQQRLHPQPFHDQELQVLELLCQILQTDSLSWVQRWLLLAGHRERDLVLGMIRQALAGDRRQQLQASRPTASPPRRKPAGTRADQGLDVSDVRPGERIGGAEVLQIPSAAGTLPHHQEQSDGS